MMRWIRRGSYDTVLTRCWHDVDTMLIRCWYGVDTVLWQSVVTRCWYGGVLTLCCNTMLWHVAEMVLWYVVMTRCWNVVMTRYYHTVLHSSTIRWCDTVLWQSIRCCDTVLWHVLDTVLRHSVMTQCYETVL